MGFGPVEMSSTSGSVICQLGNFIAYNKGKEKSHFEVDRVVNGKKIRLESEGQLNPCLWRGKR